MTEAEHVWRAYIDAWNTHHIDSILAAVAEQFIYDERPMTMKTPLRGKQAFRRYLEGVFNRLSHVFRNARMLGVGTQGYSLWGSSAGARMAAAIGSHGLARFGGDDLPKPSAVVIAYTGSFGILSQR